MKTFKTKLLTIALLLCGISASAYDFEANGLYYNLLSASGKTCELAGCSQDVMNMNIPASVTTRGITLTVSSIKESAFENNTNLISVSFVDNPMTSVAENSFKGCTNLTQVELSNTLETIESGAFDGCPISKMVIPSNVKTVGAKGLSNVIEIEIANGNEPISFADSITTLTSAFIGRNVSKSFVANTSISTVTFGTGITEIAPSMFAGCKQIKEISIPANIVSIGDNAFHYCEKLEKFKIEDSEDVLTLGEDTVWIERREYSSGGIYVEYNCRHSGLLSCTNLKEVYIGRNLIYPSSFNRGFKEKTKCGYEWSNSWNCNASRVLSHFYNLGTPFKSKMDVMIIIGDKVTRLGNFLFEQQSMLSFKVPDNCKEIGDYCFYHCHKLQSIDLNNCNSIGSKAFLECDKLQSIDFGATKIIGRAAFEGCEKIDTVNLLKVETVSASAFERCESLKKVEMGDSVKVLQSRSFANCPNLHIVSVGEGLTSIPQECFLGCQSIQWISLGSNLSQIGSGAFGDCCQIANIEVKNVTPPVFEFQNELSSVNKFDATLYIPQGSTPAYEQSDVWKDFLFKQESEIPEYVYKLPENDDSKSIIIEGDLTGAIINQINSDMIVETLDLQMATLALDNQNAYYKSGKRVDSHWDDVDVVRGAPYYSYAYYTAPTTETYSEKEYNNSGYLINVITTCFSSGLTNAKLNGNLKSIKLPSTLTELGENAIEGTNLTDLYVYSTTPPTATVASFGNTNKTTCVLHVPEGYRTEYESAAGWSCFKNIVESSSDNYIEVQPTNENRQVKLARNDADATYQWYKYVEKTDELVDITNILSATSGWENTDNGWESNMHEAESSVSLSYEHTFNVGDVLSFDWGVSSEEIFDQLQVYLGDELLFVKSGNQSGTFSKTFESTVNGKLNFIYVKDGTVDAANDNALISNVKISIPVEQTMEIPEAIEGEINRELNMKSVSYDGDKVFCIVTLGNGKRLRTNDFICEYQNFIKTQPTIDNLIVELDTPEDGTKYQWYKSKSVGTEFKNLCDELTPISSDPYPWTKSWHSLAEAYWWHSGNSRINSSSSTMKVDIDVQAGDKIRIYWSVYSEKNSDYFFIFIDGVKVLEKSGEEYGTYEKIFDVTGNVLVELVYKKDEANSYSLDWGEVQGIELTHLLWEDTEIAGATTAKLDKSLLANDCMVYCIVTLPDGRTLVSDKVQIAEGDTGIEDVTSDSANRYIVYNLYGILVMNTMEKSDLNKLSRGIYIVNGKKVFIK